MRIARGVYRDRFGYRVIWPERGRPKEKRFPSDTPLDKLKAWRVRRIREAQDLAAINRGGSFVRDVVRFLRQRKGRPSFKSDRAKLRAWVQRFRARSRWAITAEDCALAVADWQIAGYSARELRHRVRLLRELYRILDGSRSPTPVDDLDLPRVPTPRPVSVAPQTIRAVAAQLRLQENPGIGRLRTSKTRARFLVLATTGMRPAQVMRAQPFDVDLERRIWTVRPAKGDRGAVLYLNDDMTAAWRLFVASQAWGHYDSRSFARRLRHAGWPKGIRPYNLRHSIGLSLSALGVDLGDIQAHMGHADLNTTRTFYVPALPARQQAASEAIDHRIVAPALTVPRPPAMSDPAGKGRKRQNRPVSAMSSVQQEGRPRRLNTSKTA